MFWFSPTGLLGAWLAVYLAAMLQANQVAGNHHKKQPLVIRNAHSNRRSLQSKGIRFDDDDDEEEEGTRTGDLNTSDSVVVLGKTEVASSNDSSWKYSPQVVVTLDSTLNRRQQSTKGKVQFVGHRKDRNPASSMQHLKDDYFSYKLHHQQPLTDSSLLSFTSLTKSKIKKKEKEKEKCSSGDGQERVREGAKQFSELTIEQTLEDAASSRSGDTGVQQPKKISVRLGNDVRVRSDLLLVRTPATATDNHNNNIHYNSAPIVRGLEVRNLSGSWMPEAAFEQRTEPLIVKLPGDDVAQKEPLDYSPDESRLQSRDDDHLSPSESFSNDAADNNIRGQLVVRASTSASQGIRVIQEPGSLGLVMNQRGLIVAPKRSSYPSHSSSSSIYNASALFTNHIDHSLSPVKVTPHADRPVMLEVSRPAFLGQRPPLVSTVRWRNTTKPLMAVIEQQQVSPHQSPSDSLWAFSKPQSNAHYSTTSTSASVSPETLPPLTTQRPTPSTSLPPQFLHNPPYKQNLLNPNLDLASSQQLVQEYDQKLASRTRLKQQQLQSNKRPTGTDLNSSAANSSRITANRYPAPTEFAPASGNYTVVKEQSNSSSSNSHEPFSTKPPFEMNSTISNQLNTLGNLNHNNDQSSSASHIINTHTTSNSHPMKPSLTTVSTIHPSGGGKFMNKLQHLIIGKILKNQALGAGPNSASGSASTTTNTYAYHQSPSSTPTSLVPQQLPVTPAPLLSSTVANNVASLIAQKLSSIFVKSVGPSLAASGYIVNPGVAAGQSNTPLANNPLGGLSTGLSSLFGHRVGGSPNRPSSPIKQRFPSNIHSPIRRRTVGMGSLLASGLIYGISLLPALMALTGINPLAGSARTSNQASAQNDLKGSTATVNRQQQMTAASTNNIKKLPAPQNVIAAAAAASNQMPAMQDTIAYLVPLISTLPASLEGGVDPLVGDNDIPLEPSPFAGPESNEPLQLNESPHHNHPNQFPESTFIHNQDQNLMDHQTAANFINHTPLSSDLQPHPYSKYKGHLYYSRSFAPASTSNWQERDNESSQPSASWENPRKRLNNIIREPGRKEPVMSPNSHRFSQHPTSPKVGIHPQVLHNPPSAPRNTYSTPLPGRSYQVGYTLSYKPVQETHQPQASQQHESYIEFQDVNDLAADEGSASQWRPLIAQRGFVSNRAKFNLNQIAEDNNLDKTR